MLAAEPLVSVVLAAHNAGNCLARTVSSVLAQQDVALELIVVDDGSVDDTWAVLQQLASDDDRIRPIRNLRNQGLTASLITGCNAARGRYIARQDADDLSLPGRLRAQVDWLEANPGASFVSCHTRFIGLFGEVVMERRITADELAHNLTARRTDDFRGPSHHGSVMMRASSYAAVGGYRATFTVAQDLDLWLRLIEHGPAGVVDMVGYAAQHSPEGISAQRMALQREFAALAGELAAARRAGRDESGVLASHADRIVRRREPQTALARRHRYAAHTYFLGRCVRTTAPAIARRYFLLGLKRCPWHLRSWYGLAASLF